MSAVAIQSSYLGGIAYARPVTRPVPPRATAGVAAAARPDSAIVSPGASTRAALAGVQGSVDHASRVSGALAVADDRLSQIGALLAGPGQADAVAVERIAASARFGATPLLDGTYSASVGGRSISLPSFRAGSGSSESLASRVNRTRTDIDDFRSSVLPAAAHALGSEAERLAPASPDVSDSDAAATNALLFRARSVLDGSAVVGVAAPDAQRVLSLIG